MCGIAGIWNIQGNLVNRSDINLMVNNMEHRGPDSNGYWINENLGLGHARLKIIDISNNANQPFTEDKDTLIFNGEIFNFNKLKKELPLSISYKSSSDTEVLFRCLQHWGLQALNKIEGQFSFAFYNFKENSLLLARDHVGICPLYYIKNDNELIFASEIRPILELRKSKIDQQGVIDYFSFRYNIQNGNTLFSNIKRFHPSHYWLIDLNTKQIIKKRYWRLKFYENKDKLTYNLQNDFNKILDNEIKAQSISDVPVGMFLSGGIDSGALLSGLSKINDSINSFTMNFNNNDADLIRVNQLNERFHFKKNIINFSTDTLSLIEDVVFSLEEPFGDLIITANYQLAKQASQQIKVVLSGEGGDEAFLGYDHQRAFLSMVKLSNSSLTRFLASNAISMLPSSVLALANSYPGGFGRSEHNVIKNTFSKIMSPKDAYLQMVTLFNQKELKDLLLPSFYNYTDCLPDIVPLEEIFQMDMHIWQSVMRVEIEQFTLIVNLLKQERLSMCFSLEGRVPLVSKNVLTFVASLPFNEILNKINKKILINYSGSSIIKKKPFSVFSNREYKKMLEKLINIYITKENVNETEILNWNYVKKYKNIKNAGFLDVKKIMVLLVFIVWYKKYKKYF